MCRNYPWADRGEECSRPKVSRLEVACGVFEKLKGRWPRNMGCRGEGHTAWGCGQGPGHVRQGDPGFTGHQEPLGVGSAELTVNWRGQEPEQPGCCGGWAGGGTAVMEWRDGCDPGSQEGDGTEQGQDASCLTPGRETQLLHCLPGTDKHPDPDTLTTLLF